MRSTLSSKRFLILGVVVLVVGALSVAAIAQSGGDPVPGPEPAVQAEADANASALGIFNGERTAADELPAAAKRDLAQNPTLGANANLSVRIAEGAGRIVYAVPARDAICFVIPDPLGTSKGCQPSDTVGKTGPGLVMVDDKITFYDIVPEGTEKVVLNLASGKTIDVAVQEGGYTVTVDRADQPESVTVTGANGSVTQSATAPPLPTEG